MITNFFRYLFSVQYPYTHALDRQQARGLLILSWLMMLGWVSWVFGIYRIQALTTLSLAITGTTLVFVVSVFYTLQSGYMQTSAGLMVGLMIVIAGFVLLRLPENGNILFVVLALPIAFSGMLLNRAGITAVGILLSFTVLYLEISQIQAQQISSQEGFSNAALAISIVIFSTVAQLLFVRDRTTIVTASNTNTDRLKQIIIDNSKINIETSEIEILNRAIRLIREKFDYDFVQILLMDSTGNLSRRVRPGMQAVEDILTKDIPNLGDATIISEAARIQQPIQASIADPETRRSHFLPSIQRGLVMPLIHDGETLGIIDIQNVTDIPISEDDIALLMLLANQTATTLHIHQHIGSIHRTISEQESQTNRLQNQLSQLQAQRQQMVTNVWADYVEQRGKRILGFDLKDGMIIPADEMPLEMQKAFRNGEIYVTVSDDEKLINVPITLRGEILGGMTFAVPASQSITERQLDMAQTIAARLGTALENTRLLEQTQAQASRERKATEIANLLLSATDVDSLLRLAADAFNDTLGAIQTRIYLEPQLKESPQLPPASNGTLKRNGDGA